MKFRIKEVLYSTGWSRDSVDDTTQLYLVDLGESSWVVNNEPKPQDSDGLGDTYVAEFLDKIRAFFNAQPTTFEDRCEVILARDLPALVEELGGEMA